IGIESAISMPVRSRAVWAERSDPNIQAMPSAAAPVATQVPPGIGSLRNARARSVVKSGLTLMTTSVLAVLVSVSAIMKAVNITVSPPERVTSLASHTFKQVGVAPADFELLRTAFDRDQLAAALVAHDAGNGARVDERRAVDLPELSGVELLDQLLDGFADE